MERTGDPHLCTWEEVRAWQVHSWCPRGWDDFPPPMDKPMTFSGGGKWEDEGLVTK